MVESRVINYTARDESGVDNFRIRSDPNPNYADVEKSF
jgi:hypothetical protein